MKLDNTQSQTLTMARYSSGCSSSSLVFASYLACNSDPGGRSFKVELVCKFSFSRFVSCSSSCILFCSAVGAIPDPICCGEPAVVGTS